MARNAMRRPIGKSHDCHQCALRVKEKENCHERDDDRLFDEFSAQCSNRGVNQTRSVVSPDKAHAFRERALNFRHLLLDGLDHGERIRAVPHHDPAGDDLALAVEVRDPASQCRSDLHVRHIANCYRNAARRSSHRHPANVIDARESATSSHDVLRPAHLEHAPANILIRVADGFSRLLDRNPERKQFGRVDLDLIFLLEAAQ